MEAVRVQRIQKKKWGEAISKNFLLSRSPPHITKKKNLEYSAEQKRDGWGPKDLLGARFKKPTRPGGRDRSIKKRG